MRVAIFRKHKNDPLCFLIGAIMRTGYTHAAVEIAPNVIVEAFWPYVRQRQLSPDELEGIDFFEIEGLTDLTSRQILAYCVTQIGRKARYSITNLLRFLPFVRPFIGEAKDDGTEAVFCSQFVFDALTRSGVRVFSTLTNSWEVDPGHLAWSPTLRKV